MDGNSLKNIALSLIISSIVFFAGIVDAGNFGAGVHSGYGILKYEEQTSAFGTKVESKSTQNVILFGVSGEYSFSKPKNLYVNITTDWVFGLQGNETWKENNTQIQATDIKIFEQFYDLRFGYKNSINNFHYRFYVSGGRDIFHFKRDKFIWRGTPLTGNVTEDINLWRIGIGTGFGYKLDRWAIDGRLAYENYPVSKVNNSSLPQFTFDTNGTVLDMGFGMAYGITQNVNFYFGGSYSLLKFEQSDIMQSGSIQAVYPENKTEIILGMLNLTYAF